MVAYAAAKYFYRRSSLLRLDRSESRSDDHSSKFGTTFHSTAISPADMARQRQEKIDFIRRVGYDVYGYTGTPGGFIDDWRADEFPTLIPPIPMNDNHNYDDATNEHEVYVDYAGAALPTQSQMREIFGGITDSQILGNPHSMGPAASRSKAGLEQVTKRILDHFHAQPGRLYGHGGCATTEKGKNATTASSTSFTVEDHPGYEIIFTSGTTDAIRIVGEHFPWRIARNRENKASEESPSSLFIYAQNSHTSVIGIREIALQSNSSTSVVCQPIDQLFETILRHTDGQSLEDQFRKLSMKTKGTSKFVQNNGVVANSPDGIVQCRYCVPHLFVVPLECNFSGDRAEAQSAFQRLYDIDSFSTNDKLPLCGECQQKEHHQSWYTMLDIAKAASTGPVNLCELNPDFACVSFYKMFGEPTGLGCLFVKRTAIDVLFPTHGTNGNVDSSMSRASHRRHYVGGGSVNIIVAGTDYMVSRSEPTPLVSLQRGTPHFRGIVALSAGFNELDRVGGMERINRHTQCLRQEFVRRLQTLRHSNGRSAVVIYGNGKIDAYDTSCCKVGQYSGSIVALNVLRADGSYVGYNEVSKLAALHHHPIQLRTGCFCNPGACQIALDLSDNDIVRHYEESGHICGDPIDIINNRPTGAMRISFGKDSTWEDMNTIVTFLQHAFVSYSNTDNNCILDKSRKHSVPTKVVITELYIFPIKSCAAQQVTDWPMDPFSGRLFFDREFAIVDATGAAMRLQMYPAMAQLRPVVDMKTFQLTIVAPDASFSPLILDLEDQSQHGHDRKRSIVKVCGNRCGGVVWGDHSVSEWFSRYLGVRCWLARHTGNFDGLYEHPKSVRDAIPIDSSKSISFANEQPLLLISEHAVKLLNHTMRQSKGSSSTKHDSSHDWVCSRQFRPNIVVRFDGDDSNADQGQQQRHVEDCWSQVSMIDDDRLTCMTLEVVGPCARCAMVDIDPINGTRVGTLRALATYRRNGNSQITFGIFLRASSNTKPVVRLDKTTSCFHISEGNVLLCE